MKNLKHKLNIQLFGDDGNGDGGNQPNVSASNTAGPEIDYTKLAEIVNGRTTKTEESVLKGYFKDQGLSQDEVAQAIETFKTNREQSKIAEQQKLTNLEKENQALKTQMLNAKIDTTLTDIAAKESIVAEKMPFLLKLVERKDLVKEDGTVDEEKAKTAINDIIKAFPDFKDTAKTTRGFQVVGADGSKGGNEPSAAQNAFMNGMIIRKK